MDGNVVTNWDGKLSSIQAEGQDAAIGGLGTIGHWRFINNVFVDVPDQGANTAVGMWWINNTFIRCGGNGHAIDFNNTPEDKGVASNAVVLNNLFIDCGEPENVSFWVVCLTNKRHRSHWRHV
jgi:hypothetical protein